MSCDIAVIGLAVMGENLILNMASKGYTVAVFNRTTSKVDHFTEGRAKGKTIVGTHSVDELPKLLKKPRKVLMMVQAGKAVDQLIDQLEHAGFEKGDIFIDGGNSNFEDTTRRTKELAERGFLFVGSGVSGGEEGALNGPSIMPGGNPAAWEHIKEIFQSIAAKVEGDGAPCCDWVGDEGAGHFVKMVHNGIEYGDMQLISEAYYILKNLVGLENEEISKIFGEWNEGQLRSYLIEITQQILVKKDDEEGTKDKYVLDLIVDSAGQKGTGKWTVSTALELGQPLTLIGEAVFARMLSAQKEERVAASKILPGPKMQKYTGDKKKFIDAIGQAIYCAKLVSYAQGYVLMRAAAGQYKWKLNYGPIALSWRGGCIIRSLFLKDIEHAFRTNPELKNLLLDEFFTNKIKENQEGWREVAAAASKAGIAIPAISSALSYYDGYRTERLPANMIQAQRDFFGAHTYQRIDKDAKTMFHTNWTGHGGTTAAGAYNA